MTIRNSCLALLPLALWSGCGLFLIFHAHGGHQFSRQFARSSRQFFSEDPACLDPSRLPHAYPRQGRGNGDDSAAPLVLVQVTDLHVSDVDGPTGKDNVSMFMEKVVPMFKGIADAIVITGDLVNAKQYAPPPFKRVVGYRSEQTIAEWSWYNETVTAAATKLGDETAWITVPGNHDVFGTRRYYDEFSREFPRNRPDAGEDGCRERLRTFHFRGHSVVAIDATLFPSPHRPLNFFGSLNTLCAGALHEVANEPEAKSIVFLSHYPSAVLAGVRSLDDAVTSRTAAMPRSTVLLSGHLHSMRGMFPTGMQALSYAGRLELQLPDLCSAGFFRIFAVENGLPSWTDYTVINNLPDALAIVLNIPRAGLCVPGAGRAALMSTHIRVLVVGKHVVSVKAYIDGAFVGEALQSSGAAKSVYAIPWDSSSFCGDERVHLVEIVVTTANSRSRTPSVSYHFACDGRAVDSWQGRLRLLGSSFFTLSNFERIAILSVYFGLCSCLVLCSVMLYFTPCLRTKALCLSSVTLWLAASGPFLITVDLNDSGGIGYATLGGLYMQDGALLGAVDPYFAMFSVVLVAMLPVCYCCCLTGLFPALIPSSLISVIRCLTWARSLFWTLNIAGAHGLMAAFVSPSCVPLSLLLLWCCIDGPGLRTSHVPQTKYGMKKE